jgi:hypothetical protein
VVTAPVRLTFPSYDTGAVNILADGKCAGFALAEFYGWRAYLFPVLTESRMRPDECEEVTAKTLGELRKLLRERVAERGAWWT